MKYIFDPAANRIKDSARADFRLRYKTMPPKLAQLRNDGGVFLFTPEHDKSLAFGKRVLIKTELNIVDFKRDTTISLPLGMICQGGSGVPVIYNSWRASFEGKDRITFVSVKSDTPSVYAGDLNPYLEVVVYNLITGSIEKKPYFGTKMTPGFEPDFPVPAYMRNNLLELQDNYAVANELLTIVHANIYPDFFQFHGDNLFTAYQMDGTQLLFMFGDFRNRWAQTLSFSIDSKLAPCHPNPVTPIWKE